jgi:putative ubiquitin-RnfH superfamily antitoxin RatB of RatAB toxin-antitoxin module
MSARMRCVVAYATRDQQQLWAIEIGEPATIGEVIAAARTAANRPEVPWDSAAVGVFGEARTRMDAARDGDRIELYRPLRADPRERRREGVRKERRAARGSGR